LESIVRGRYEDFLCELENNLTPLLLMRRYMSVVLPAARHYGISDIANWERPAPANESLEFYELFISDVDYCISSLRLKNIERAKVYSVALDAISKTKLRHLLDQIRETVDKLDISVAKKDRLYSRINALQVEIDRERTPFQAFAALMIEACDDIGEAAKRLEPAVRLIERVAAALGKEKRSEDAQLKLPSRKAPKQIEGPKIRRRVFEEDLGDEIPF
jgi:hypothetical protein